VNGRLLTSFFAITAPAGSGLGGATTTTNTPSVPGNGSGLRNGLWTAGLFVAAGDVNGDGFSDVIIGADAGGGPEVQVFDGKSLSLVQSFYALPAGFTGGVRVASGDVNGDGFSDIIIAAGKGGGPAVIAYDGTNLNILFGINAFPAFFTGGVYVAAGDVNSDGIADIICGAGPGGGPMVAVYDGASQNLISAFFAYTPKFRGGVRVAVRDVDNDPQIDILTTPGPGGSALAEAFEGLTTAQLNSFFAYTPGFRGGAFVG
jgi:hypothetical protein